MSCKHHPKWCTGHPRNRPRTLPEQAFSACEHLAASVWATDGAKVLPKSCKRHPKVMQRSSRSHLKVIPTSSKSHPKVIRKASQRHANVIPSGATGIPEMEPKPYQNKQNGLVRTFRHLPPPRTHFWGHTQSTGSDQAYVI